MSPFELALGVKTKQPMDLAILRIRNTYYEGSKDVEEMAKDHEEKKSWAIKFLKKMRASYEKQANKSQRCIKLKMGDLMWLNIKDFKMLEALANRFIPEYAGLYKVIHKPHPDVYTLQLLTTLVVHPTFHVSKLKPIHDTRKGRIGNKPITQDSTSLNRRLLRK
jgi:hypothetical protein